VTPYGQRASSGAGYVPCSAARLRRAAEAGRSRRPGPGPGPVALAGNRRLEHDFDGLEGRDRDNLAAARADLRDAAATELLFDRRLLAIAFPPRTERIARLLFAANQARARLTGEAAASTSLRQLRAYQRRLDEANRPVEDAVQVIRSQLDLSSPDKS
jgi:hypothetical protein